MSDPAALAGRRTGDRRGVRQRLQRAPAWLITAAAAIAYVIAAPASPDLAAAAYRGDLFSRVGFTLWDNSWYGGHHLPAYSLIAPALSALLGPRLLSALAMTAAAAAFAVIARNLADERPARFAAAWFAVGAAASLLSGRVPFDVGLAIALASFASATRRGDDGGDGGDDDDRTERTVARVLASRVAAGVLALLSAAASPVAGAFLGLGYVTLALSPAYRRAALGLAALALAPVALLALAFPEGGTQPFVVSAFFPALALVLALLVLTPPSLRTLRFGIFLYAVVLVGAYVIPSAVGGNATRLGALAAGPVAAVGIYATVGRRRALLLAIAPLLLYWQFKAPVSDVAIAGSDPAVHASYYRPLLAELRRLDVGYGHRPVRLEALPLADHWEARWLAPHVMLARGWERQLDRQRDALFYSGTGGVQTLSPKRYVQWLREQAVAYVAVPDARLDYSARAEARLIEDTARGGARAGFLREIWHSAHWRLFAVEGTEPLTQAPGVLDAVGSDWFELRAPRPGDYVVRLHFTRYWELTAGSGCISRAPGDWTSVRARAAGELRVQIGFSPARLLNGGPRCT